MPTPPRDRLRVRPLEDRALPSAAFDPPAPTVVTGTDAHDVITLASQDGDRVTVTIRSFLDPEWTQPTGDPVRQYQVHVNFGSLAPRPVDPGVPVPAVIQSTTGTIRVEGGAGQDRIDVSDVLKGFFVSGTHRTDETAVRVRDHVPVIWSRDERGEEIPVPVLDDGPTLWWQDERGERWATNADIFTCEYSPFYTSSLSEGIHMADGATVGIRFHDLPWVLPAPGEPWWYDGGGIEVAIAEVPAGDELSDEFASGEGLDLQAGEGWPLEVAEAGWEGDAGTGWTSNDPALSDLWVEWADDLPADWVAGEADYGPDGSEVSAEDGLDEWLETNVASEG